MTAALLIGCSPAPEPSNPSADATVTVTTPPDSTASAAPTDTGSATATASAAPTESASAAPSGPPIVGGYKDVDVKDPDVVTASQKAIDLLKKEKKDTTIALKAVKSAKMQVVAGRNYDLTLDVTTKGGPKTVKVIVQQDLKNNYTLGTVEGL